jgi:hypothetical protein
MARYHDTVDGPIPYTPEEEAARDAEEAQILADKPMNEWLEAMAKTDNISRALEDIYDVLTTEQQTALAGVTKDKILAKKSLRLQKP